MLHDMESRLANIGYTLEDSLRLQGKTMDAYQQELHPVAERRLKGRLVLAELAGVKGSPSPEEVQAELRAHGRRCGERRDPEDPPRCLRLGERAAYDPAGRPDREDAGAAAGHRHRAGRCGPLPVVAADEASACNELRPSPL